MGQTKSLHKTGFIINDGSLCPLYYLLHQGTILSLSYIFIITLLNIIILIILYCIIIIYLTGSYLHFYQFIISSAKRPLLKLLFLLCKMQFLCLLSILKHSLAFHEFPKKSTLNQKLLHLVPKVISIDSYHNILSKYSLTDLSSFVSCILNNVNHSKNFNKTFRFSQTFY